MASKKVSKTAETAVPTTEAQTQTPVAVKSDERPDTPRKASETSLDQYPVTPAGHSLLLSKGMAFKQPYLRARLIADAKGKGMQLTKKETATAIENCIAARTRQQEERAELSNVHRDETAPSATVACGGPECKETFQPNEWNVVRNGEVVKYNNGDNVTQGSYIVTPEGEIVPLCRQCMRQFKDAAKGSDTRSYTYARAERVSGAIKRDQARQNAFQKMGRERAPRDVNSPNFQRYLNRNGSRR